MSFGQSLMRSFSALLFGLGFMIPIVSLITMIRQYTIYTSAGETEWDDLDDVAFSSRSVHPLRWIIGVGLIFLSAQSQSA